MKILITGSSGHLGEALTRTLQHSGHELTTLDITTSPFTSHVGSITDRDSVHRCMTNIDTVLHTATLHKPHVDTHSRQQFLDTNITGTLNLLEEATAAGVKSFIYTSTTSVFGDALIPPPNAPAAWITEDVAPIPKNIYGVTKSAAEDLCQLFHRNHKLPCIILRTSRFFPEADDSESARNAYDDANLKLNEFLHRRVDIEDVVSAHLLAAERAPTIKFARYIISATTPFTQSDLAELRTNAPAVLARHIPEYTAEYARRHWKMNPTLDRVYINARARTELGWIPQHDFRSVLHRLQSTNDIRSSLAKQIRVKGYHASSAK